jgi:excisionase family DNA binding protein
MTPTNVENLLTVEEALQYLRISRSKLHQMVRKGELAAVKFGRRTLFRKAALDALITAHETVAKPATANVRGLR